MEIIPNGGGGMKRKKDFYIILLFGIGLIITSIMMVSRGNTEDSSKKEIKKEEDFIILNEEEPYLQISRMEEELNIDNYIRDKELQETFEESQEETEQEETVQEETTQEENEEKEEELEEKPNDSNYTLVDAVSSTELETMVKPVDGEIGLNFTSGNLIYSKTLEEWTNHNGIDILASEGTEVRAALAGTITEVYRDELWGIVIIIDHGNGLLTKYANLSEGTQVMEGSNVNKGDIIGTIGQTAPIEMLEKPHLHFEVIESGINQNPLNYLPKFSFNK